MNAWRWLGTALVFGGLLATAGLTLPAAAQDKEKDKGKEGAKETKGAEKGEKGGELKWTAFDKGGTFYQETNTKTKQNMTVMGMEISQDQDQTFYMSWTPQKEKDKDGNWSVKQKITGVKMTINIGGNKISYDSTAENQPNNPLTDFFKAVQQAEFTYTISPGPKGMKVTKIDGRDDFVKKLSATNPQMEGFLKSILSEQAMISMAEQTWFALPPDGAGKSWSRESELDLGPVGKYTISMNFARGDAKDKNEVINLEKASMTYAPPGKKGDLPFEIKKDSTLTTKKASGQFLFNTDKGRWESTQMEMDLEGTLNIEVGGMETAVRLEQNQKSSSKFSDTDPLAKGEKKTK